MTEPLLRVENLKKHYVDNDSLVERLLRRKRSRIKAVDGVSFEIDHGDTLGLVGESGCGKSTTGETLLGLRDATAGHVYFEGMDIFAQDDLTEFRRQTGIVFQDPFSSLDPRMTVSEIIREPMMVHDYGTKAERRDRVAELLDKVGLSTDQVDRYPHEFSGGQRQRIGIARALSLDPKFLVLDEPVSALDVSVQAQILNLLADLQEQLDLTYLFIAHDLSVVRHISDNVAVMYLGKIVEKGPVEDLFLSPKHPYTEALLQSVPRAKTAEQHRSMNPIAGDVPSPRNPPSGCNFRTRCPEVIPPEETTIPQTTYRRIMDLRETMESDDKSVDGLLAESNVQVPDYDAAVVIDTLFSESLPEQHETVIETALNEYISGEEQRAIDRLRERFESKCEREVPTLSETKQSAACFLYEQ